jgi:hypothetical protein
MSAMPPIATELMRCGEMTRSATTGLMQCNNRIYSITSSARASNVGGISRPSALAICRLMASTELVGRVGEIAEHCTEEVEHCAASTALALLAEV